MPAKHLKVDLDEVAQAMDDHSGAVEWYLDTHTGEVVPLPVARGGMGKAVYARGEFWVFGGETLDGPGATSLGVYNRVDVYDPVANRWRAGPPMPTARPDRSWTGNVIRPRKRSRTAPSSVRSASPDSIRTSADRLFARRRSRKSG